MEKFKDFFSELVKRSGLSCAEISRRTGKCGKRVAESSISSALDGKRGFSVETINSIAGVLKISNEEKQKLIILAWAFRESGEAETTTLELLEKIEGNGMMLPNPKPKTECPVWSNIKAGPADLSESTAEIVGVSEMTELEIRAGCFCVLVTGDSMEDERVFDGDVAQFQPFHGGEMITDRDIYALHVEGSSTWQIKKIRKLPGGKIALISANKKYPAIEIDPEQSRITVKGRLLRTIRERGKSFVL